MFFCEFCDTINHGKGNDRVNGISVLKMKNEDVHAVALLEGECFSSPWSETSLLESLENEGSIFLCAKSNEKIVGYIGASVVLDEAYVSDIAVAKSERRKGIGKKLLEECEKLCRKKGASFLSLEVRKSNEAARALYEKRGFCVLGERKNFYSDPRENALVMTKYFKE